MKSLYLCYLYFFVILSLLGAFAVDFFMTEKEDGFKWARRSFRVSHFCNTNKDMQYLGFQSAMDCESAIEAQKDNIDNYCFEKYWDYLECADKFGLENFTQERKFDTEEEKQAYFTKMQEIYKKCEGKIEPIKKCVKNHINR